MTINHVWILIYELPSGDTLILGVYANYESARVSLDDYLLFGKTNHERALTNYSIKKKKVVDHL